MSSANGDKAQSRRKKRRGGERLTPTGAGEMLREARERLGIDLAEVHDRTGISWRNLEALESGDLQRFADPSSAATAMRRYADLVELDSAVLIKSLENPVLAYSGGGESPLSSTGRTRAVDGARDPGTTGHLRRYDTDRGDLRSFTQTAEVPAVGGSGGLYPGVRHPHRRRKAPLPLRLMTWLVLLLLVVGGAGLGVYHYKPEWLRDIHVLKSSPKTAASALHHAKKPTTPRSTTPTTPTILVRTTTMGVGTADVKVAVSNYTVVVSATNPCWVYAQAASAVKPIVNQTLVAGQKASIPVTGGQLSLELGSVAATISVQVGGKTQFWELKPDAVPFVVTFSSA
ncbi:MAG: helix-turn-helix transcriptional regulator [Acidimicrobiales bacterium]